MLLNRYKQSLWGIVLFAVAGLLVSGYLSYLTLTPSGSCPITETSMFSCDAVIYSEYASPSGIPLSFLGLGWFVIALGLAWLSWRNTMFMRCMVVWSLIGLAGVAGLAYVEFSLIKAICAFCTVAHACGLAILALSLVGWRSREKSTPESTSNP